MGGARVTALVAGTLAVASFGVGAGVALGDGQHGTSLRAPTALKASSRTQTSVTLRWKDRARGEQRYVVTYSGHTRRLKASARSVKLTGLSAKRFRVTVKACTSRSCGKATALTVPAYTPKPGGTVTPQPMPTGGGPTGTSPTAGSCPVLPANDPWNQDVSKEPVDPRSDAYINAIGGSGHLHPDFGSGQYGDYGIPFEVVPASQPDVPIRFDEYGDQSDPGPYPIPTSARIEGAKDSSDGDRHVLVVHEGDCKLYELYHARVSGGGWVAGSGAVFDLVHGTTRPAGWTSADAAGLPIMPGLARADEASAGAIRHALRFTVSRSQAAYVAPARHLASDDTDPNLPPMGLRLRLKASYDRSAFHGQARAILDALATYGMIVADNGSSWYISGTPDANWNDDDLDQLKGVPGSAFEVVKSGPLQK